MSSISADDAAVLKTTGQDIIRTFVAIVVETYLYATYACLVVIATRALLKVPRRTTLILLAIVILMFMFDTILWIFDIHDLILETSTVLTSSSSASLANRYAAATDASLFPLAPVFYTFMTILGDVIIIWRVFAFWTGPRERWLLVIPLAVFTMSFVTMFMIIDCSVRAKGELLLGNFDNGPYCQHVQTVSYLANTLTTLFSTVMISYKTWEYRRTIGHALSESSSRSRVERVMIILVESGVIYFLFFLEVFISSLGKITEEQAATPALAFASTVYIYASSHIVGIYPTIIVILVHFQKSYIDTTTQQTSINFATTIPGGFRATTTIGGSSVSASTAQKNFRRTRGDVQVTLPGHGGDHELGSVPSSSGWGRDEEAAKVTFMEEAHAATLESASQGDHIV